MKKIVILLVIVAIGGFILLYKYKGELGKMCGGIAGNLPEYQCTPPLTCKYEDSFPDASGKCVLSMRNFFGIHIYKYFRTSNTK